VVLRTRTSAPDKAMNGAARRHTKPNPRWGCGRSASAFGAADSSSRKFPRDSCRASHYGRSECVDDGRARARDRPDAHAHQAGPKQQLDEKGPALRRGRSRWAGMIEIPAGRSAAILHAQAQLHVDRTNDLIQYTLPASTATDDAVAHLYDPLAPGGALAESRGRSDGDSARD